MREEIRAFLIAVNLLMKVQNDIIYIDLFFKDLLFDIRAQKQTGMREKEVRHGQQSNCVCNKGT